MLNNLIYKKLEQMSVLLSELKELSDISYSEFKSGFKNIRSAERNFQLVVELASDINAQIVSIVIGQTPDTYKESFRKMVEIKVLDEKLLPQFVKSSVLRNILIHEYDFDEDNFIFYNSIKEFVPLYRDYISTIHNYISKTTKLDTE